LDMFEKFYKKYDPLLVASTLTSTTVSLRRKGIDTDFSEKEYNELFSSVNSKTISKEAIQDILEIVSKDKISVKEAIKKSGLKSLTENDLREIIKKIFKKYSKLVKEKKTSALMGEVMKEVRGKIDGKVVSKVLNEELKKA
ncbi:MAG: GatB/YqeY domain-containing protein, partial [Candidatus Aenigmarchaeota archaeon]|nr:GatB/YqeY domain-containing protein [Candidatus Aenigmarchaeota archaeon]